MCYGTILSESLARAAKAHTCDLCHRAITSGQRHVSKTIVDDGDIGTERTCETCNAIILDGADEDDGCYYRGNGLLGAKDAVAAIGWKRLRSIIRDVRDRFAKRKAAIHA